MNIDDLLKALKKRSRNIKSRIKKCDREHDRMRYKSRSVRIAHPTNKGHYLDMLIEVNGVIKLIEGVINTKHYVKQGIDDEMSLMLDRFFGHI